MSDESLADLHPFFRQQLGVPEAPAVPTEAPSEDLSTLHPFFAADAPRAPRPSSEPPTPGGFSPDAQGAAMAGAGAGFASRWFLPKPIPPKGPSPTATMNAEVALEVAQNDLRQKVEQLQTSRSTHGMNVDSAFGEYNAARTRLEQATQDLARYEARARAVGAVPEAPVQYTAATIENGSPVPGAASEGAMRHSNKMGEIRDVNEVRNAIRGSVTGEPGRPLPPLTGYGQASRIIVPNDVVGSPVYNGTQIQSQEDLLRARAEHEAATKGMASSQKRWEGLSSSSPAAVNRAETAVRGAEGKIGNLDTKIAALKAQQPGIAKKAIYAINKIPLLKTVLGSLSLGDLYSAYEAIERGDVPDTIMSGAGGVGGLMMWLATRNPRVQLVGGALSAVGAGRMIPSNRRDIEQGVVAPEGRLNPAAGLSFMP